MTIFCRSENGVVCVIRSHTPSFSYNVHTFSCSKLDFENVCVYENVYGVATISRLLEMIGLFCRIWSLL